MKKRVFIIHGWEGYPEEGWFPWLKQELEVRDFEVTVPSMPDSDVPKLERWLPYLKEIIGTPDAHTYLVGHSMGARALMHYVADLPEGVKMGGIVSVAGAFVLRGLDQEERAVLQPWLDEPLKAASIHQHTRQIVAIFSDNDPWIPLAENKALFQKQFQAEIYVLKNQGHFSGSDGIAELPLVLDVLLSLSK